MTLRQPHQDAVLAASARPSPPAHGSWAGRKALRAAVHCRGPQCCRGRRPGPRTQRQAWLERHPRFHVHSTPTGSCWINQVERWFGYLANQKIRCGVHKSVQALEADIRDWIKTWNDNPRPFTWTKTADEIFDSLAKYIARISGAAY